MNVNNGDSVPAHYEGGYDEIAPYAAAYRYAPAQQGEGASGDFARLLSALRDKVWWILAAMVIGGIGGFAYSRTQHPTYRTSATVWLEPPRMDGPIVPRNVFNASGSAQVFTSNAVMQPVVFQFRLHVRQIQPEGDGEILDNLEITDDVRTGAYQIRAVDGDRYQLLNMRDEVIEEGTISEGVGSTRGFHWVPDAEALARFEEPLVFRLLRPLQAASNLGSRLAVRYDEMADVIHSDLTWADRSEIADLHNAIIESFQETTRRLSNGRLSEEVEILREQRDYTAGRLAAAELALQEFRIEAITQPGEAQMTQLPTGVVTQDPFFGAFFQQRADLDQLTSDLAELDAILAGAGGGNLNVLRLRLVASIQNSSAISSTLSLLDQLDLEVRTLLYTYTHEWPDVIDKSAQIRDIHETLLPGLIRELQADLRNRQSMLSQQIVNRAGELREIPKRTIEEARLTRQASMAEGLHNTLLTRLSTAELAEETGLSSVRQLDTAFTPGGPLAQTLPAFFILLGSAVGLGMAVGGVLVRDRLDQRIRHPDDISMKFGLPLLGVVPQLRSPDSNRAAAAVAIESFRSIRTQITHAHGGAGGLVLITSSTPREGKSVVAANLAISYASAGLRTLLIDADVRRGRLHSVFNLPRSPGLTEHLAGEATLADAIRRHESADLDILCSGALSADAELIGGERLETFLRQAHESYDVVVLDGPPLAAGADALILGQRCDKVVMVFRAGTTSEGMARSRLGMLGNVDLPIVGAVLNAVPEHAPYYDQYVNYYYYTAAEAS